MQIKLLIPNADESLSELIAEVPNYISVDSLITIGSYADPFDPNARRNYLVEHLTYSSHQLPVAILRLVTEPVLVPSEPLLLEETFR